MNEGPEIIDALRGQLSHTLPTPIPIIVKNAVATVGSALRFALSTRTHDLAMSQNTLWLSLALFKSSALSKNVKVVDGELLSEAIMREIPLTIPEIGMINSTRFIIGTGVGLLVAGKLDSNARRAVGLALISVGVLISIPVAISFIGKLHGTHPSVQQISDRRAA